MQTEQKTAPKPKQKKITFALNRYPEVDRMLNRFSSDFQGTTTTHIVVSALREYLTKRGYARKKDLAK